MVKASKRVEDYVLYDQAGKGVKLSRMFGRHDRLVVLHNMGKSCPNCALWGDEFNFMRKRIAQVAGLCIVGPDDPATQAAYRKSRGWQCRLLSARGTSFIRDLGFEGKKGDAQPGVSILQKKNGALRLVKQVNVMRDKHCPSVLEVFWMLPGVDTAKVAWAK